MSIGFMGGLSFGICFYLLNRKFKDSELNLVRVQPYSVHRNAEKVLGVELAILFAMSWSIFIERFY